MQIASLVLIASFTAPPPQTTTQTPPRKAAAPARPALTVTVTDMEGNPLPEVWVRATGAVDREGPTDADGSVMFRNMAAGAYRLRFEHDRYVTLERDVTLQAKPLTTTVALTAAPPSPAPQPEKAETSTTTPALPPPGPPTSISIPDFVEKNFVGGAPSLVSPMGCAPSATSSLLQLRDPLADHRHADADEMLYVVAGEGTHRVNGREERLAAGVFAVVPRGTTHSIARRGSRPIIVLSILSGERCAAK